MSYLSESRDNTIREMNYELAKKLKDAGFPQVHGARWSSWIGTEQEKECLVPTLQS